MTTVRISLSLTGVAALSLASIPHAYSQPAIVAQGPADELGVMSINLKEVLKSKIGFQGQTQAAGTPNEGGLGGYIPILVGENSVFFADILANINFSDWGNSSSIVNTLVSGTTISTSSRLGYRWLSGDRNWMFGINGGYDTRPMSTGEADDGRNVSGESTVFYQQAAFGLEAINDDWSFNAYGLVPTGTTEYELNSNFSGGALDTYGLDAGYRLTPDWKISIGYYYQNGEGGSADGSGVLGRLAYDINEGLTLGTSLSYDNTFKSRLSADVKWRFKTGSSASQSDKKKDWEKPSILALSESVKHRSIRVADKGGGPYAATCASEVVNSGSWQQPACTSVVGVTLVEYLAGYY